MKTRTGWLLLLLISVFTMSGCSPRAKYERRLKHELASGVRYDSLFFGLYFGMPEKDFYLLCWQLNKNGLIRQGDSNTTVYYELKNQLKYPAAMDFYPKFKEGRIFEMPVRFKYVGWAPWNKNLTSDKLQYSIVKWYEKTYGKGFIEIKSPERGSAFVKIDGNRRISIFKESDLFVWAVFTDLLANKESISNIPDSVSNNNDSIKDPVEKQNE